MNPTLYGTLLIAGVGAMWWRRKDSNHPTRSNSGTKQEPSNE